MTINFRYHVCHLHTKSTPETDTVETVEAYLYGEDENGKKDISKIDKLLNLSAKI